MAIKEDEGEDIKDLDFLQLFGLFSITGIDVVTVTRLSLCLSLSFSLFGSVSLFHFASVSFCLSLGYLFLLFRLCLSVSLSVYFFVCFRFPLSPLSLSLSLPPAPFSRLTLSPSLHFSSLSPFSLFVFTSVFLAQATWRTLSKLILSE